MSSHHGMVGLPKEDLGAVRPGPIYARIWIDQEVKKKMGF